MTFMFRSFQQEMEILLLDINSFDVIEVRSLDDLRSGIALSQILTKYTRKPDLYGVSTSTCKENMMKTWNSILCFIELNLTHTYLNYSPQEIIEDLGVLFVIHKITLRHIKRHRKFKHFSTFSQTSKFSLLYVPIPSTKISLNFYASDSDKAEIQTWLHDLRIIPPGVLMHEFLYRIRSGFSLLEVLLKLDSLSSNNINEKLEALIEKPRDICECIDNINKILRYLRGLSGFSQRYINSSASIYEGNEKSIYGLLQDIKIFYGKEQKRNSSAPQKRAFSLLKVKVNKPSIRYGNITSPLKSKVIDWISTLGLLKFLYLGEDLQINSILNGVLLCKVIETVFRSNLHFTSEPISEQDCLENMNLVLNFLSERCPYAESLPSQISYASEELGWEILWEIMNNSTGLIDTYDANYMQELEPKILEWIKQQNILSIVPNSLQDIIPYLKTGVLISDMISKIDPQVDTSFIERNPRTVIQSIENISNCLNIIKKHPIMNKELRSYSTKIEREIYNGKPEACMMVMEDLYICAQNLPKKNDKHSESLRLVNDNEQKNIEQIKKLEEWVSDLGLKKPNLSGKVLKDFRSGVLLCEILKKLNKICIQDISEFPKTKSEALGNIRKALNILQTCYSSFPVRFCYLDDQIVLGDGIIIRSLLQEISDFSQTL